MRIFSKLLPASKWKLLLSGIGVFMLIAFSSLVIYAATQEEVVIINNGEKQTVKTHAKTVEALLNEVGIEMGKHDKLSHKIDAKVEAGMEIDYQKAKQVYLTVDGKQQDYFSTAKTVKAFFTENNIVVSPHDKISHQEDEKIKNGLHIDIVKAFKITVNDGGKEKQVWTTGGTVKQLLAANDITYKDDSDDKIKPALNKKVTKKTAIKIVRVENETEEVEEAIAFETETKEDNTLEKGKEEVVTEGRDGIIVKKYAITIENGKEVNRELVSEEIKEESQNRVVTVGTKEVEAQKDSTSDETQTASNASDQSADGKVLHMTASAYTAGCNGCSGYTSTGINLIDNPHMKVVAVDPNVIPMGSKLWVEGYGNAIAGDTGGHISGNRIDLHFPSKSAAYAFGKRTVKVKIID